MPYATVNILGGIYGFRNSNGYLLYFSPRGFQVSSRYIRGNSITSFSNIGRKI